MKGETVLSPSHWFDRPNVFLRFWTINTFFFPCHIFLTFFPFFVAGNLEKNHFVKVIRLKTIAWEGKIKKDSRINDRKKERKKEQEQIVYIYHFSLIFIMWGVWKGGGTLNDMTIIIICANELKKDGGKSGASWKASECIMDRSRDKNVCKIKSKKIPR